MIAVSRQAVIAIFAALSLAFLAKYILLGTPDVQVQPTPAPPPTICRLGDFFSTEFPIEYLFVHGVVRAASSPSTATRPVRIGRVVFSPGTDRFRALVIALNMTRVTEKDAVEGDASGLVRMPSAPGIWGLQHIPPVPSPHFSILRQKNATDSIVRVAIGEAGLLLVETRSGQAQHFRADTPIGEWLALARCADSSD